MSSCKERYGRRPDNVKRINQYEVSGRHSTLQKSKFDQDVSRIKELLGYGLSVRKIAKVLGYSSHIALNTYINKRGLREAVKN